jgi:hypothetical protein
MLFRHVNLQSLQLGTTQSGPKNFIPPTFRQDFQPAVRSNFRLHILVVSPHRDDAAFSLTLAMGRWIASRHRVTILNVFTRSLDAAFSDADTVHLNDRLAYVSALRRREDEQFLKQVPGVTLVDLNMKDAAIRLHCDPSLVPTLKPDAADTAIPKIQKAIGKLTGVSAIVLPLGLGHHVDHLVVRSAGTPESADFPHAFYEERPSPSSDAAVPGGFQPLTIQGLQADPVAHKRRIALLYASQIDAELADLIAGQPERLWVNEAWIKLGL